MKRYVIKMFKYRMFVNIIKNVQLQDFPSKIIFQYF